MSLLCCCTEDPLQPISLAHLQSPASSAPVNPWQLAAKAGRSTSSASGMLLSIDSAQQHQEAGRQQQGSPNGATTIVHCFTMQSASKLQQGTDTRGPQCPIAAVPVVCLQTYRCTCICLLTLKSLAVLEHVSPGVQPEYGLPARCIWWWHKQQHIQPPGAQQGRVQRRRAVGGSQQQNTCTAVWESRQVKRVNSINCNRA